MKVGIIGTGNIGTDLLVKIQRSQILECTIFTGKNPDSEGIKRARSLGIPTSVESIRVIEKNPDLCDIVFDATSAESHLLHAPILKRLHKFVIDMTPSRIGKMCVPLINLDACLHEDNVNMVTCGGQATAPLIAGIMKIHPEISYVEVVSSIASKSAGIGTRNNIDEYTQTTSEAIKVLTGVPHAKAIIILNPVEPPMFMHNTIFAEISDPQIKKLQKEIGLVVHRIQKYVPGYRLVLEPTYENNRLTTIIEVVGRGDFLPRYAGNLDIINCAAITLAENFAESKLSN
jgi:acetaldehyde dehydrogenase